MAKDKGIPPISDDTCSDGDMVSMGPCLGNIRPFVRHHADHHLEPGIARLVSSEQAPPNSSNSIHLRHRYGNLYDVIPFPESASRAKGPSKVNSDAFRSGWDTIFGKKVPVGQA
jgi:hypothetical protein